MGGAYRELDSFMYPFAQCSLTNLQVASSSLSVCQYILQSMVAGAPGLSVMAWSSSHAGE